MESAAGRILRPALIALQRSGNEWQVPMTSENNNMSAVENGSQPASATEISQQTRQPTKRNRKKIALGSASLLALGIIIFLGIRSRVETETRLAITTDQAAVPVVDVIHPKESPPAQEIVLPGTTEAFTDAPIYARTNGYLEHWYFDIGAHVKKGQLLADIQTPEVDQQLQQARADFETAEANMRLAQTTATRWQFLVKSGSVSQQETDQATDNLAAMKAAVDASAANVRRLEQLQSFEKIYAPFDGVITQRNTDVGDLIDAGASTEPKQLFNLAAINVLRVYVAVPEVDAPTARPGVPAVLTFDEYPGESFPGRLVRTSDAIDLASRTLRVEVDVDNPTGKLLPGAYVFVNLKVPAKTRSVTVPANTLLFRKEGLQVGVVRNGKVDLISVNMGYDYGTTAEIVSGLKLSDDVILNPADSLIAGAQVRVNNTAATEAGQ
jgi:RND family efflux transporter MFP subunit